MKFKPTVSVIIPTYNRRAWLCETLDSLARQTWPTDQFEVIVVNDGSTDDTEQIATETFPFLLRYIWQQNQGDAEARNTGVRSSKADILVFLDDDVLVDPDYLTCLIPEHEVAPNKIVVGTEYLWLEDTNPLKLRLSNSTGPQEPAVVEQPFAEVCSNNMSVRREAYYEIGMMESLDFPGSSIWCDVDFAYRAYRLGFEFRRSTKAICWHRDHVSKSLENSKNRMRKTAYRAVALFQKYPDLPAHLPMFYDKSPICWGQDSPGLVARKLVRQVVSSGPALWSLEQVVHLLEKRAQSATLVRRLSRWVVGGYIFRGYREGLRKAGLASEPQ